MRRDPLNPGACLKCGMIFIYDVLAVSVAILYALLAASVRGCRLLVMVLASAFGTFSLDYEREGVGVESVGQRDVVDVYVVETERALARLAVEMHVVVALAAFAVASA